MGLFVRIFHPELLSNVARDYPELLNVFCLTLEMGPKESIYKTVLR
jgi:hypothetical protein